MRALICDDYGGIDALRVGVLPDPEPGPGSILVQVEAAAVNFADVLMVKGQYQVRPDPPFSPGYELAGTVLAANGADGFGAGDRIAGFAYHGAIAERAVIEVGEEDGLVVVSVTDNGPGIEPGLDPFARGASGTGSTGYGLWLARAIAEAHGGTLELADAPARGARLRLSLPSSSA